MTSATEEQTAHALPLLAHLTRLGSRHADEALAPTGLRPRHVVALMLLRDSGPAGQQGLASALTLDPSNVVGLLNELEARDLVVRRRDPADRRRHIVELSATGADLLATAQRRLARAEDELLHALSPEQRATLKELLVLAAGAHRPERACIEAGSPTC